MSDGFTHRRRRRPLRATASWSGAVSLRRLSQGRLDTLNWRYDYDAMSGLRPASSGGDRGRGVTPGEECLASHTLLYPDTAGGRWWGVLVGGSPGLKARLSEANMRSMKEAGTVMVFLVSSSISSFLVIT